MLTLKQAIKLHEQGDTYDLRTPMGELFYDFITFINNFDTNTHCFDVPNGRISSKSQIDVDPYDDDLEPTYHPYFIVDPFDKGHNPGK